MENKKRLIDANAIKYRTIGAGGWEQPDNVVSDYEIDKIPTVDAVEVVHGRWINPYVNRYGHPCHCCSVCGFKASYQDKNYCPNCGAKMDGGNGNG